MSEHNKNKEILVSTQNNLDNSRIFSQKRQEGFLASFIKTNNSYNKHNVTGTTGIPDNLRSSEEEQCKKYDMNEISESSNLDIKERSSQVEEDGGRTRQAVVNQNVQIIDGGEQDEDVFLLCWAPNNNDSSRRIPLCFWVTLTKNALIYFFSKSTPRM